MTTPHENDDEQVVEEADTYKQQDLAVRVQKLKAELTQCRKERDEYLAGWQRSKADFINARKEEDQTREGFTRLATRKILEEVVGIVSIFDRAFDGQDSTSPYIKGFGYIRDEIYKLLEQHGATPMDLLGKPFNVHLAEAVESIPTNDEDKDAIVVEEIEKGFMLYKDVLRPGKVKVAYYENPQNN